MLDFDVSRNRKRFPPDYQFQLTEIEWAELQFRLTSFSIPLQNKTPTVFTNAFEVLKAKRL
jgi:hypothetical protein